MVIPLQSDCFDKWTGWLFSARIFEKRTTWESHRLNSFSPEKRFFFWRIFLSKLRKVEINRKYEPFWVIFTFWPSISEVHHFPCFRKYFPCLHVENLNWSDIRSYLKSEASSIAKYCTPHRSRKTLKSVPEVNSVVIFKCFCEVPDGLTRQDWQLSIKTEIVPLRRIIDDKSRIFIECQETISTTRDSQNRELHFLDKLHRCSDFFNIVPFKWDKIPCTRRSLVSWEVGDVYMLFHGSNKREKIKEKKGGLIFDMPDFFLSSF